MTEESKSSTGFVRSALIFVGAIALVVGIGLGLLYYGSEREPASMAADLASATLLPRPKPVADFALVDQENKPVVPDSLRGRWTFLAFGYTHCPDICPTMMATFDALEQELAKTGTEPQPRFLFVSVDPERDTPKRLGQYVGFFNPRIRGATADHQVLRPLTAQFGILYQRSDAQGSAMGYLVDHSASMLLLDPQVRLSAIFSAPHDPLAMAADFRTISSRGE